MYRAEGATEPLVKMENPATLWFDTMLLATSIEPPCPYTPKLLLSRVLLSTCTVASEFAQMARSMLVSTEFVTVTMPPTASMPSKSTCGIMLLETVTEAVPSVRITPVLFHVRLLLPPP